MLDVLITDAAACEAARQAALSLAGSDRSLRRLIEAAGKRVFLSTGLHVRHLHAPGAGGPGRLYAAGVTCWTLAAYGASRREVLAEAEAAAACPLGERRGFGGLDLEGPFISGGECEGAGFDEAAGLVASLPCKASSVVFAPECVSPDGFLAALAQHGVEPVVGYTVAEYEQCLAAFEKGARGLCMPFVATAPVHHRRPGAIGAAGAAGAWVEAPVGLEGFTVQQARFLAKAFGARVRPVYHPVRHGAPEAGGGFPAGFAGRAAAMLGLEAGEFLSLAAAPARAGTFVLFDEKLAALAAVVDGAVEHGNGKAR